ncbi:BREX-1 system adenine-specific DNA-methyltransferase PglX [Saccharicrinis fermentans]|nr:BREX-1 system adenine-specific DNA-methyltransferase PglX [Saccharicrinis fermentans]
MYEEQGYNPTEIPELIITKNLHGVDIDPRAAQLASFVLFMKGRQKHRRFLRSVVKNNIKPNITFYQDFEFDDKFNNASALGSLIKVEPNEVEQLQIDENSLFGAQQAELKKLYTLLGQKYDVVVTNPPYISSSRMEGTLKQYVEANYPETKSDLFATFILRCLELCNEDGLTGYMTPFVWMFISSYEKLRAKVIDNHFINNLIQLEYSGFDGATVPICTFTLRNKNINDGAKGSYIRLSDFKGAQNQAPRTLEAIKNPQCGWFYTANQKDFEKIPEYRLGYWLSGLQIDAFVNHTELKESHPPKAGLSTANNDRFLRFWWEIDSDKFGLNYNSREDLISSKKWIPMTKGGKFKKWFGNNEYVLNFSEDGEELKYWLVNNPNDPSTKSWSRYIRNYNSYCKPGISFSDVSSGTPAFRMQDSGFIPNSRGPFIYSESKELLGFLNSKICVSFLELLSPTLTFNVGDVSRVPFNDLENTRIANDVGKCIEISSQEFYSIERSWYYNQNELIRIKGQDLEESYDLYQQYWQNKFYQLHKNEEELNKQFIEIYGLQEELTPDVPLADITILKEELDQKQLKAISERYKSGWQLVDGGQWVVDSAQSPITNHQLPKLPFNPKEIFKQFISYAVGCMFGRYSLDKEGLILANQGETLEDYVRKVAGDWWIEDGEGNWIFNPKKDIDEYYQELQRAENLATGQENGQGSVYSDEANAQRGTIQSDQSDQKSGSQYTQQHSRGAVQGNEGVYSLSEDSTGIAGGAPDSTTFDHRFGNDTSSPNNSNTNGAGEFEQTNKQPDSQAAQQLPTATHHPLSTNLQAPITFMPDDDNIIPVLDDEWFDDDIAGRFKEFLKVSFGAANYDKNLAFVEECLGKDIRKYFIKDFYADHIKRYKKRPIYWQFSSPKSSFSVLIYMHRYTPDTLSQILNGYLKEYREKLNNRIENVNHLIETGSSSEQTKAAKEKEKIEKVLHELQEYERDILYPLATERIAIDLDDGVLVNYNKFGTAIKAVAGLNDKKTKDKVRKFDWIDVEGIRG